jgi:hypothetical protein
MAAESSKRRGKRRGTEAATETAHEYTWDDFFDTPSYSVESISADGRRTHQTSHTFDLPSPLKRQRQKGPPTFFADIGNDFEYVFEDLQPPPPTAARNRAVKPRAKRYLSSVRVSFVFIFSLHSNATQDAPLAQWVPLRDEYLAECLRLEGRGDVCITHCPACPEGTAPAVPQYRCMDCANPDLYCKECCVAAHKNHPLDRIEVAFVTDFLSVIY